jgi:anti-anti-sigma regulatory factor
MHSSRRIIDGASIVTVAGAIETDGDAAALDRLLAQLDASTDRVVLDVVEVTALGLAGVTVLADAAARMDERGQPVTIVIGEHHDSVLRAVEKAKVLSRLRLFDTVEHALAARPGRRGARRERRREGGHR